MATGVYYLNHPDNSQIASQSTIWLVEPSNDIGSGVLTERNDYRKYHIEVIQDGTEIWLYDEWIVKVWGNLERKWVNQDGKTSCKSLIDANSPKRGNGFTVYKFR